MKKLSRLLKGVSAFCLFAGATLSANAFSLETLELGVTQTFQAQGANAFSYTPTENGILTVSLNSYIGGEYGSVVYSGFSGDEPTGGALECTCTSGYDTPSILLYDLEKNQTYYLYTYQYSPLEFTATFGETAGGNEGPDIPSEYKEMEMTTYTGISTSNPLLLYYTAPTNGTLTVSQKGNYDSHIFKNLTTTTPWGVDYKSGGLGYNLVYDLTEGQTVYFIAPERNIVNGGYYSDGLTQVQFTWVGASISEDNIIKEGVEFEAYNKIMEYTPTADGYLTVKASTYTYQWLPIASSQGLLFTDYGLTKKANLINTNDGAVPSYWQVYVKANQKYYLYNSAEDGAKFTFTLEPAELTVKIVEVAPTPGEAIDDKGDYGNGVLLTFNPGEISFDSATITYYPNGNEEIVTLVDDPSKVGENADYAYEGTLWKFKAVSKYYTLTDKGTSVILNLTNVNYDGVPLTSTDIIGNPNIEVKDGNLMVKWNKPEKAMTIVDESWPDVIYGKFEQGDPAGIATITFDDNISSVPSASMVFGKQIYGAASGGDAADPGMDLPSTVDGNKLIIDFTDIDFAALYNTGSKTYSQLTVFVGNIKDSYGQKFIQDTPGIAKYLSFSLEAAPEPDMIETTPNGVCIEDRQNPAYYIVWEGEEITAVSGDIKATLKSEAGVEETVDLELTAYGESEVNNAIMLSLRGFESGEYTLSLAQGVVMNAEQAINPEGEFTFTYTAPQIQPITLTVSPEEGQFVETDSFSVITVTYPAGLVVSQINGDVTLNGTVLTPTEIENGFEFDLGGDLTENTYALVIPETWLVFENGDYTTGVEMTYVIISENDVPEDPMVIGDATAVEILGEEGVSGLNVTWAEYAIAINEECEEDLSISCEEATAPVISKIEIAGNALLIEFEEEFIEEATLVLSIPEGFVFVGENGAMNKAQIISVPVKPTGVAVIGIDYELNGIYTLQGVKVNASKALQLPAGLYIINGKKVLVK